MICECLNRDKKLRETREFVSSLSVFMSQLPLIFYSSIFPLRWRRRVRLTLMKTDYRIASHSFFHPQNDKSFSNFSISSNWKIFLLVMCFLWIFNFYSLLEIHQKTLELGPPLQPEFISGWQFFTRSWNSINPLNPENFFLLFEFLLFYNFRNLNDKPLD